ncbi:MerR family transcriptional regulator [Granulicella sp. WH15]|uniref:MerR family transcriptional regulator n=1 Tax=Granulicella sp. WH15 TaxID=2602070 RepID=UPI001366D072|nr:MerR family transcriptional regulator [Granulicella sp. WH15]QHN02422.1 MerR family transcriptional regulator [Granulicella sp. WH15]
MAHHEPIRRGSGSSPRGSGSGSSGSSSSRQEIPDKLYFRIGEVAKLCAVPAYVLRFWEGEFPQLRPNKGGTGQRLYRRRDVEMALRIKTLLYDEGYTIPGARQAFKLELRSSKDPQQTAPDDTAAPDTPPNAVGAHHLQAIRKELAELHSLLSRPASAKSTVQPIRRSAPEPAPKPKPAPRVLSKPIPFESLFDQLDEPEPNS